VGRAAYRSGTAQADAQRAFVATTNLRRKSQILRVRRRFVAASASRGATSDQINNYQKEMDWRRRNLAHSVGTLAPPVGELRIAALFDWEARKTNNQKNNQ
jgi:hypothetical protein